MHQFEYVAQPTMYHPLSTNQGSDGASTSRSGDACSWSSSFVSVNNSGVLLLRQGQYDEAISCFTIASFYLNHILQITAQHSRATDARADFSTSFSSGSRLSLFFMIDDNFQQVLLLPGRNPDNQKQYVFQNPIMVSERAEGNSYTEISLPLVAAYNLALSYHLSASHNKSRESHLQQALFHYEISYRLTLREETVIVSQAMILLNNIGHIHCLLDNHEGARLCFQFLLSSMMFVQHIGDSSRIKYWDSLISNVLDRIVSETPSPAPAA